MFNFPFPSLREGQQRILDSVEETIDSGESILINAATGLGKTAPVLTGALRAAEKTGYRIAFLTAKHTHQRIVCETMRRINATSSSKARFSAVSGKASMCLLENSAERSMFIEFCRAVREQGLCEFYSNTFTKQRETAPRAFSALNEEISDPESVIAASEKFRVCPYEISLLNAKRSNVIIANYAHIFSADVSSSFISKADIDPQNTILIVDEAHNLPSKVLEMNSSSISIRTLERAVKEMTLSGCSSLAGKVNSLINMIKDTKGEKRLSLDGMFDETDLMEVDEVIKEHEKGYNVPSSYPFKKFLSLLFRVDSSYVVFASGANGTIKAHISSLDPSKFSSDIIKAFKSSILISGTMKPMSMFSNLLGIQDAHKLAIEDGFVSSNRLLINETLTTSRFSNRESAYPVIAKRCESLMESLGVNTIFFFPSYEFMRRVRENIRGNYAIIVEEPEMTREKKSELLSHLETPGSVLFAVIGGNFSESIGLPRNIIKLVVIVGIPFEPPSVRLNALQDYYQKKFGNGFEYAQVLPAAIKTMQAAGRALRSDKDRAAVILMDSRFGSPLFTRYLPSGIKVARTGDIDEIAGFLNTKV